MHSVGLPKMASSIIGGAQWPRVLVNIIFFTANSQAASNTL